MIYIFFIIVPLISGAFANQVFAQTQPTATPSAVVVEKEIQNLKEKIATKVAELRKKNLKAISGVVIDTPTSELKIETQKGDEYIVQIDDTLTKIYQVSGSTKKDLKLNEIKKGAYVIVTGPVTDKTISANVVYKDEQFLIKGGKVTEVDTDEETIKVLTTEKDNYTLDVDKTTKIQLLDSKTLELETIRLPKVKEGDTIHLVTRKTGEEKQKDRYTPLRILIIPQEYFIK